MSKIEFIVMIGVLWNAVLQTIWFASDRRHRAERVRIINTMVIGTTIFIIIINLVERLR